jgi:hypothetical protein
VEAGQRRLVPALVALVALTGAGRARAGGPDGDASPAPARAGRCFVARGQTLAPCPDDRRALDEGRSKVDVVTKPPGRPVALVTLGRAPVRGGDEVWLAPGTYVFEAGDARSTVTVAGGRDALVLLELGDAAPATPGPGDVDFGDEGGGSVVNGPPPKIVHPTLVPKRYRLGLAAHPDETWSTRPPPPDPDRARVGVYVGPTVSRLTGDGWTGRTGVTVGVLARTGARAGLAAELGLAWQRRGGAHAGVDAALDELALPATAHARLWRGRKVALAASLGAELSVRLEGALAGAPVGRLGADALAGVDAELLGGAPIRLEVRGALGLTRLGDAGRGWAVTAAVGVLLF